MVETLEGISLLKILRRQRINKMNGRILDLCQMN